MTEKLAPLEDSFLKNYPLVKFNKGDVLIKYGQLNQYLYYIKDGICSCSIIHTDGNTIIPLFLKKGDVIGIRLEILGARENRSIHEVSAHTDVITYKIPVEDIRHLLQTDFAAYRRATESVIMSLDRVLETTNMRGRGNSVMMVCNVIIQEMEKIPGSENMYRIPHHLTVTDIANSLLIHRITVSRIMHSLCDENVLRKEGTIWYITDLKKLEKYRLGALTLTIRK